MVPLLREPDDSGIDSDDQEQPLVRVQRVYELVRLTESSSSDEEPIIKYPWVKNPKKEYDELVRKHMEERRLEPEELIPMSPWRRSCDGRQPVIPASPDRSSPPLYEVELTASDEDDEASVLELVIPHQTKIKAINTKTEFFQLLCRLICCMDP